MTTESITGLILTIIFLAYLILETITSFRKHTPINPIIFILMAIGVFIGILLIYRGKELSAADLAQTILTIGLLTITAVYAWSTEKMAKATKEQATASMKMAETTEKSIKETVRPIVKIDVEFGTRQDTESGKYYIDKMHLMFKNIGRGPALHLETNRSHPCFDKVCILSKTILEIGEGTSTYMYPTVENINPREIFELLIKYQDIYGRWFYSKLIHDGNGQFRLEYDEVEKKEDD